MQFRMLGPLEATHGDHTIALGGIKQRATLGFLLLKANQVVATSQLLDALWSGDDPPVSARKMVQNAVWSLRAALCSKGCTKDAALCSKGCTKGVATLSTQAPGYVLHVDPEHVDLYRFYRKAEEGRAELAAGSPEVAAQVLRDALASWRGTALADLVESGIAWSELAAVQQARLNTREDYFDASLACGRHHVVLSELEAMVESEPLRERSCGQLMLALYRCGRHADALSIYSRVRAALVEDLGLEPGPGLQKLQHAILTHDPALTLPHEARPGRPLVDVSRSPQTDAAGNSADTADVPVTTDERPPLRVEKAAGAPPLMPPTRTAAGQRQHVSVAIVRAQLGPDFADADPAEIDNVLAGVAAIVRVGVEQLGGTVAASIGSASLALFGAPHKGGDDEERAVRAALKIRDCLSTSTGTSTRTTIAGRGLVVHAAVATGEALVRYQPDDWSAPPTLNGALIDKCQHLLSIVPGGEVWICDSTRQLTEHEITCHQTNYSPAGWRVKGTHQENPNDPAAPATDHESELRVLQGLLEQTRHRAKPHLVTVLDEPGTRKASFLAEFERRVVDQPTETLFLMGRTPHLAPAGVLAAQIQILMAYCGIQRCDSAETARDKLIAAIRRLTRSKYESDRLLSCLIPLVDHQAEETAHRATIDETLAAWQHFLELAADDKPVVVAIDDLHRAGDDVLNFVEELAETSGPVPLLVVATARPELLDRRPGWGGGQRHVASITLDPLSDGAVNRLRRSILSMVDSETKDLAHRIFGTDPEAAEARDQSRVYSGTWNSRSRPLVPVADHSHQGTGERLTPRAKRRTAGTAVLA